MAIINVFYHYHFITYQKNLPLSFDIQNMAESNLYTFLNEGFFFNGIGNDNSLSEWLFPRKKFAFYVYFLYFTSSVYPVQRQNIFYSLFPVRFY